MKLGEDGYLRAPSRVISSNVGLRQAVRLQVSTGSYHDATLMVFKPSGTMTANSADMRKMANENNLTPEIFSKKNNSEHAISKYPTIAAGMSIPIGFRSGVAGSFTVNATELAEIPQNISVLLRDNVNGNVSDLTVGESYTFVTTAATNNATRFSLQFVSNTTGFDNNEKNNRFSYVDEQNHIVALGVAGCKVTLYDASGRIITEQYSDSDRWAYNHPLTIGVYLLKITDKNNAVKTDKLIIR
jgi:hypothetical protein